MKDSAKHPSPARLGLWRAPLLVAAAAFLVTALLSSLVIVELERRAAQEARMRAASLASGRAQAIQTTLERALSSTYALAAMVRQGGGHVADFEGVATEMLSLYPGVAVLGLSPGGVIQRIAPLAGNEKSIGFDQLRDPKQGKEARLARDTGKLTLAGPLNLVQGGLGVVGRLPVMLDGASGQSHFWGLTYAVIRFPQALSGTQLDQLKLAGLEYTLWRHHPDTGTIQVITTSTDATLQAPVEQTLTLPNGQWTLSVAPTNGWGFGVSVLPEIAFALFLSLLTAYAAKLYITLKNNQSGQEALIADRTRVIVASQDKLQATLDAIPDLILELDIEGICHSYHASPTDTPFPPEELILGKNIRAVLPQAAANAMLGALRQALEVGYSKNRELLAPTTVGPQWFEMSISRKYGASPEQQRFIVLVRNINQRKQTETDLRIAATAFNAQEGMAITDANERVLRINLAFTEITGFTEEDAVGRRLDFLKSGLHEPEFYEAMLETVRTTGSWRGDIWNRRKNGEVFPSMCNVTAVRDDAGNVTHWVNSLMDITSRKATEEEVNKLAFYDPLTGLPNRRLLIDRLRHYMAASSRSGLMGSLQFIDLDNFKTLNDTLGHDMGDLLLQQVAKRLTDCMREGDTVARLGGDEFVVLLVDISSDLLESVAASKTIGEKILATFALPYKLAGVDYQVTPSIGITQFQGTKDSTDELLKQADLAMYQAKAAGRNTLRFFDPAMQATISARVAMETDIRHGIARGEFLLYYQPQIDRAGHVVGAEVLLRWPHPVRGMVPPGQFIPLAEDTGQILPLGNWVLETACAQLKDWAGQTDFSHLTLAVNVSARQFRQQDFAPYVLDLLRYTGANPARLKLELTESMLVHDVEETIEKMNVLKAHGIGFSLDDFGTGYSSLSYLKRLPLDQLKIDQSFVRDLMTDANDAAIANTVIALGHSLGLAVIAEGVETVPQRDMLAAQGCDAYQGYLLGRPMPVADFERQVQAQSQGKA